MTFGSLFAGIGGFDLGLELARMTCMWQVENDAACQSVLARHWPKVQRHGDVRRFRRGHAVDLICGGFPCQDLSVAGRRAGLAGKRSGLWHEFRRIIGRFAPKWVLIENVPGLLSSWSPTIKPPSGVPSREELGRRIVLDETSDFDTVTRGLSELSYGWAMRCFDSQYFGLAQRRKRVFIVGCFGDMRRAAEVLFERESLPWDSPPSRTAREGTARATAPCIRASGQGTQRAGDSRGQDCLITAPLTGNPYGDHESRETLLVAYRTSGNCGVMEQGDKTAALNCATDPNQNIVAHTLRSEGHDASEDGTGRGVPLIAIEQNQRNEVRDLGNLATSVKAQPGMKNQCYVATAIQERAVSENPANGPQGKGYQEDLADTLEARHHQQSVAYSGVRRLTPRECERLQGFPDDWTVGSDSARYRMLGNAVSVPVAEWIGRRLLSANLRKSQ